LKRAKVIGIAPAEKVQDNRFVTAVIKGADLPRQNSRQKNRKPYIFAAASIAAMA